MKMKPLSMSFGSYYGETKNGFPHGLGVYDRYGGLNSEGEWKMGVLSGLGMCIEDKYGRKYEGEFKLFEAWTRS